MVDLLSLKLYTKIQPQSFLGSGEGDFLVFFHHIWAQIVNTSLTEGSMWNLVKIDQVDVEKMFNNYTVLYMYIAQEGQLTPRGQNLNSKFCFSTFFPIQIYRDVNLTLP